MKFTTMHSMKQPKLLLILLLAAFGLQGQQLTVFNNNIANPFSINPSQAGIGESKILFQHRKQWIGVQGAPEKSLMTSEWRLGKRKTAVGFSLSRDQSNVIANTSGYVTVAQHYVLNKKHHLSFGASAGVRHNSIDFGQVNVHDPGDNLIFNDRQNTTNFDARFGLTYRIKGLEVQASALQLFGNRAVYDNSFDQKHLEYLFVRHFVASAGYRFKIAEHIGMKPIVQLRGVQGFDFQPEAILKMDFKERLWLAGHYRHKSSAAVTGGIAINDKYVLGYSGEIATNRLAGYNAGTHEILFGIKLGSAFKNSDQRREISDLEKSVKSYDERLTYLQEANRKLQEDMEVQRKKVMEGRQVTEVRTQTEEVDYDKIRNISREEAKKALEEYEAKHPGGTKGSVGNLPIEGAIELRPMTQKFYVVISSMKTENRARRAVKKAQKGYDLSSFIIHPVDSKFYYVTTGGFDERDGARKEMKRVYRFKTAEEFQGKPWVLEAK